jgi:hypothetical protein
MMTKYFIILLFLVSCSEIKQPAGILARRFPQQTRITELKVWRINDFIIKALAKYELKAKVLSKKRYRFDEGALIAPYDLVLGWGRMSDQAVIDRIDISQRSRWYFWKAKHPPIPKAEIAMCSANMHIIPANKIVKSELEDVLVGEIIYLKGFLIEVTGKNGWHWKSSLSRTDTGNGACELVYVEKLLRIK